MFGFSLSELVVVVVVALVVIGPKDLPKMLRKLGQYAGKLRRMASELRAQSGIDDALRSEGLADDLAEIRKLARGELDAVRQAATVDISGPSGPSAFGGGIGAAATMANSTSSYRDDFYVARDREYPRDGADAFNALPDNAIVYAEGLPKSALGRDPLYVLGDENGVVPEPTPPKPFGSDETEAPVGTAASEEHPADGATDAHNATNATNAAGPVVAVVTASENAASENAASENALNEPAEQSAEREPAPTSARANANAGNEAHDVREPAEQSAESEPAGASTSDGNDPKNADERPASEAR